MELKIDKPIFVAVITNKFLANSVRFLDIVRTVEEKNEIATMNDKTRDIRPMYAIVKEGVDWRLFRDFSWRKVFYFNNEIEFDKAWDKMQEDVKWWKLLTNP